VSEEIDDYKLRVEDANNATFAAIRQGFVTGGGAIFLHLTEFLNFLNISIFNTEEKKVIYY